MDVLSEKQLKEISDIIASHTGVLLHVLTGTETKLDLQLMRKLGIPQNSSSLIQNSYILGKIVQMMSEKAVKAMSYEELKQKARSLNLTQMERNSLKYAQQNASQYVTALGQKIDKTISTKALSANRKINLESMQRDKIKDKVSQAILKRQTRGELTSELYHNLEDWNRDWKRVAHTELWNSRLQGEVASILAGDTIHGNAKGGDTKVYRKPAPDACQHCKRLYLEADGVTPKIFNLNELISNGDNVGRKTIDWKPTTHTTHPNCTCPIAVLPEGFGFDKNGNLEFKG